MTFTAGASSSSPNVPDDPQNSQPESIGTHLAAQAGALSQVPSPRGADLEAGPGPMVNLELAAQRARGVSFVTSLPVRLDVKIPMPNFRFKDLARLRAGQVLETAWPVSEDLPVAAGDVRLLWAEFSVAERQLTVRVTRVA